MNPTSELQQLLSNLVESWPAEHVDPTVEQVREYLEQHKVSLGEQYPYLIERGEDYNNMWYSL